MMRAWRVRRPGPMNTGPLEQVTTEVPRPDPSELLVAVRACGVCRTDLHVSEGDLPVHRDRVTPGHEVVGEVVEVGADAGDEFAVGDRVGIAWLRHTCGVCKYCRRGDENVCPKSRYTGWDADGGYAEFATVPAAFAHHLPSGYSDSELAPLLCAGIIGYRSLLRAELPPGGRLGIYGFGGSAHITAQVALAQGAEVHVMTRGVRAQELALKLGAASAEGAADPPPVPLDAAILFAPVGDLVLPACEALDRGGTLAIAGIHLSDIPNLNYQRHLFQERQVRSVTSNTGADARAFLDSAGRHHIEVTTPEYPLEQADRALTDLSAGRIAGAAVLLVCPQADKCQTSAAARAPSPFSDQCSAIGAIRLPLRRRSQLKTNPAAPVANTAKVTPASIPAIPLPNSRVKPTLLLVSPNDVATCQRPNSSEPTNATPRNPQARFSAPCSTPRKASSSGITVCSGMTTIEAISAPEIVA